MKKSNALRILHFNTHDLSGRRFNGYDMMRHAQNPRFDLEMAVIWKQSSNAKVHALWPDNNQNKVIWKAAMGLGAVCGLDTVTGLASKKLLEQEYFNSADVIHMQLLHSSPYFSILPLTQISQSKPTVWTIHDSWAFTGGCVHPFECQKWKTGCGGICPHPRGISPLKSLTPALLWKMKDSIYRRSKLRLIATSNWMKSRIEASPLLNRFPCEKIPFGIDLNAFSPQPKAKFRNMLNIPTENHVIAFRGISSQRSSETYTFKGVRWVKEALSMYQPSMPTTLLIFQDGEEFEDFSGKYQIINMNWVDQEEMINALRAADIFLMPSTQEAFGMMAIESMACGVPVIVFEGTALPEVIHHDKGGICVPSRNSTELANAMHELIIDQEKLVTVSLSARALCEKEYSFDLYLQRHFSVYEEIKQNFEKTQSTNIESFEKIRNLT